MKKLLIFFIFIICSMPLWAEENAEKIPDQLEEGAEKTPDTSEEETESPLLQSEEKTEKIQGLFKKEEKILLRLKNRGFEIALLNMSVGFGNSLLAAKDVFRETAVVDLGKLTGGFKVDLGAYVAPVAININWKNIWGFGFDLANVSVFGNIEISENLIQFKQVKNDLFGAGAAAYVDVGIPTFFHIKKLKINLRPAVYFPIVYSEPGVTYTFTEKNNGFYMTVNYDMYIYTPISLSNFNSESFDYKEILGAMNTTTLGFDFNAGFEFPLSLWFDAGVNMLNIPLKPSVLNHYMRMTGEAFFDSSLINIVDLINGGEFPKDAFGYPKDFKPEYGTGEKKILRPFKFITHVVYRPFIFPILALIPSLGFSINPLYAKRDSIEAGIKIRLDLANMFITTIGINYEDRLWRNSIDFVINLRLIEMDIGAALESQDFAKSWQGTGARVNFALKFGW